jgi:hypothetical protein
MNGRYADGRGAFRNRLVSPPGFNPLLDPVYTLPHRLRLDLRVLHSDFERDYISPQWGAAALGLYGAAPPAQNPT